MSHPEEHEESTRDRLLRTASRLFWENSFSGTTTRMLAEALGIQKASLYHHIKSKEDLLYEISIQSLDHIQNAVTAAATASDSEHRLAAIIAAHLETSLNERDMHATMLTELRSMSMDRRSDVLERRDRYEQTILDAIGDEQDAGRLRADLNKNLLMLSLLNLLNWTIFWYRPDGDQTIPELASSLHDVFVNGTRNRAS